MCVDGGPQQHSGQSLGQSALKDGSHLKSYNRNALSYQWPSDAG